MTRNELYPIRDLGAALAELGKHGMSQHNKAGKSYIKGRDGRQFIGHLKARYTGEKRPPKAGEFYLSGAIVEAYQAPNDLSTAYHIAKIVVVSRYTANDLD